MKIDVDVSKIVTTVILALVTYIGSTVYTLDKDMAVVKAQMESMTTTVQYLAEHKKDKE